MDRLEKLRIEKLARREHEKKEFDKQVKIDDVADEFLRGCFENSHIDYTQQEREGV